MEKRQKAVVSLILISLLSFGVVPLTYAQTCDPDALTPVAYGQRGAAVRNAQACLIEAGYDIPAGATGYYGAQTRAAVRAFYADWYGSWHGNNLGPRGVAELKSRLAGAPTPPAGGVSQEVLQQVINLLSQGKTNEALLLLLGALGQQPPATPTPPTPTGEVSASLASDNPPAGTLIAGQTRATLLKFAVNNGTSNAVTVTSLKVKRGGVSSDSTLSNVYLYANDVRVSDPASLSSGYANFTGLNVQVPAGGSVTFAVVADVAVGTAGQTVNVSVQSATDIGGATVTGTFPISGNIFTIASTPSDFASVSLSNVQPSAAGQVTAGTNAYSVFRATVQVNQRDVLLRSLRLRMIGSISQNDLQNFGLYVDGTKVADSSLGSDNYVTFNLSTPYTLRAGSRQLEVRADVVGGSTRQFSFSLRYPSDLDVVDSQYNVGVQVSGTPASTASITVSGGSLTVQKLPLDTTYVVKDSRKPLAKFEFRAYGEPVKVESLTARVNWTGAVSGLRNGAIYVNGSQVGPTLTLSSSTSGTQFNNLNFTVNPGTPATVEVWADVVDPASSTQPATTVTDLKVTLLTGSNNAQATQSLNLLNVPSADTDGDTLSVVSGQAQLVKNASYGDQTFVRGKQGAKIASYVIVANQYESLTVNSFTVDLSTTSAYQNLRLSVNPSDVRGIPASSNNFSLSLTVPAGGQQVVDVLADVLTSAPTVNVTSSASVSYVTQGGMSGSSSASGQQVTVASSGALTASVHPDNPLAHNVVTGSTGEEFLRLKLSADQNEDLKVEEVKVEATTTAPGYHGNIILTDGTTQYSRTTWDSAGATSSVLFTGLNLVVPKSTEKTLYVKTDINPYSSVNVTTGATSTFKVTSIKYRGVDSGIQNTISATYAGNTMTIYRGNLTASFDATSKNVAPTYTDVVKLNLGAVIKESGVTSIQLRNATFTIESNDITTSTITVALYDGSTLVTSTNVTWNDTDTSKTVALTINRDISTSGKQYRVALENVNIKGGTGARYFRLKVNAASDLTWRDGVLNSDINLDTQTSPLSGLRIDYTFSR